MMVTLEDMDGKIDKLITEEDFDINDIKTYPVRILVENKSGSGTILTFNYRYKLEDFLMKRKYLRERLEKGQKLSSIKLWD